MNSDEDDDDDLPDIELSDGEKEENVQKDQEEVKSTDVHHLVMKGETPLSNQFRFPGQAEVPVEVSSIHHPFCYFEIGFCTNSSHSHSNRSRCHRS